MEKHVELGCLLDLYGSFLTQRQRAVVDQTVNEDCSLSEIAEREGISRQGVRDTLVRGEKLLYELEARLGLLRLQRGLEALRESVGAVSEKEMLARIDALLSINGGNDGL